MANDPEDTQKNVTGFWSAIAPGYEEHPGNVAEPGTAEHAAWLDAVREALPPAPSDVLDVGTGTGFLAFLAANLGHRVTGVDLAEPMLTVAREQAASSDNPPRFLIGDAVSPDFPPESFDVITNRHVLWTLRDPHAAFTNWRRLLRPGGCVVAIDGFWFTEASEGSNDVFDSYYSRETRDALPFMSLDRVEPIVEMFRASGFDQVSVTSLDAVWEAAHDPPGAQPAYTLVAFASG
jgi:ubiquinone/menaquinone biosynthesis C-methylase UbiE